LLDVFRNKLSSFVQSFFDNLDFLKVFRWVKFEVSFLQLDWSEVSLLDLAVLCLDVTVSHLTFFKDCLKL